MRCLKLDGVYVACSPSKKKNKKPRHGCVRGPTAEDLQSAAKLESAISKEAVQAACIFRDVLKGPLLEQFQSLEAVFFVEENGATCCD